MRNDRYESLDGIKGFALIGIIWYHLSQRSLPGGFIGVDVFFTVSGFLLALSVLREIDRTGRLRLGNFYLRRLSRLWPAMAFMIAGSVSLGLFVNHDILVGVPGKSVSALTFTSNWGEIFSGDSYFAAMSPQLLRHLWFVALLGQATLVLPLLTAAQNRLHVRAGVGAGAARRAVRVWHVGAVQPVRRPHTRVFRHGHALFWHAVGCRAGVRRAAQRGV